MPALTMEPGSCIPTHWRMTDYCLMMMEEEVWGMTEQAVWLGCILTRLRLLLLQLNCQVQF